LLETLTLDKEKYGGRRKTALILIKRHIYMYLSGKFIHELIDEDIIRLLDNSIRESKTLEYKRKFSIDEDKDKSRQEFIFDLTAMYNTAGGCIVYGIKDKKDERWK
jgi:hypothetical protein